MLIFCFVPFGTILLYHKGRKIESISPRFSGAYFVEKGEVMSICVEFQKRLLELVAESGEKRTVLAGNMGVGYRAFSDACNYGILPKPMVLVKMCDYFCLPIAYLLGETDNDAFVPAPERTTFHERLKALCAEAHITFYRLAKECHFDKSCISKWYALGQYPSIEILELIADRFEVSLDYILGRTDERD